VVATSTFGLGGTAADAGGETAGLEAVPLLLGPARVIWTYGRGLRCHAAVLSRFLDGEAGRWYCDAALQPLPPTGALGRQTGPSGRPCRGGCGAALGLGKRPGGPPEGEEEQTAAAAGGRKGIATVVSQPGPAREGKMEGGARMAGSPWGRERDRARLLRQWRGLCVICRLLGGARGPEPGAE
jgi:hypothetical protein